MNIFLQDHQKLGYGAMNGIPMVATSPGDIFIDFLIIFKDFSKTEWHNNHIIFSVRQDSPLGINPVDISGYHPPWKSLTDFALRPDIDHSSPHFNSLVSQVDRKSAILIGFRALYFRCMDTILTMAHLPHLICIPLPRITPTSLSCCQCPRFLKKGVRQHLGRFQIFMRPVLVPFLMVPLVKISVLRSVTRTVKLNPKVEVSKIVVKFTEAFSAASSLKRSWQNLFVVNLLGSRLAVFSVSSLIIWSRFWVPVRIEPFNSKFISNSLNICFKFHPSIK